MGGYIKIYIRDIEWVHLAHDREVACPCEHGNEHLFSMKGGKFLD
jgi:hypothetical protein